MIGQKYTIALRAFNTLQGLDDSSYSFTLFVGKVCTDIHFVYNPTIADIYYFMVNAQFEAQFDPIEWAPASCANSID